MQQSEIWYKKSETKRKDWFPTAAAASYHAAEQMNTICKCSELYGKQVPSLIYAMRLASYFSCNVEQLFGYSQDNETPKKDVKIHEW